MGEDQQLFLLSKAAKSCGKCWGRRYVDKGEQNWREPIFSGTSIAPATRGREKEKHGQGAQQQSIAKTEGSRGDTQTSFSLCVTLAASRVAEPREKAYCQMKLAQ